MLTLVSDTAELTTEPVGPANAQKTDYTPSASLTDMMLFTKGQPFELYREMRENAPICWMEENYADREARGYWALTRYEDVRAVDLNPTLFSSQKGGINLDYGPAELRHPQFHPSTLNNLICLDQPFHLPLRRAHMGFFTPQYTARLREAVEQEIDRLLDRVEDAGPELNLVEHFSSHLPLFTLCELLGVDAADRPKLMEWTHTLEMLQFTLAQESLGAIDPAVVMKAMATIEEMFAYGRDVLSDRRANPREDLLTAIAQAEIDGEPLSEPFLDGSWLLIVFAGNDTTRNSISGTMRLLTEFPEQKAKLLANPDLTPKMVDEAIRMVSPVIYMRRTATADTEINGQPIAEGEKVVMYYGAANRDPEMFPDPDRFDIERENAAKHIAFGIGPHVCLGQRTAIMQLDAAYRKILARFPDITWTGEIEIAPSNFVHAIQHLGVRLNG